MRVITFAPVALLLFNAVWATENGESTEPPKPPPCPVANEPDSPMPSWTPREKSPQLRLSPEELLTVLVTYHHSEDELGNLLNQLRTFAAFFDTASIFEYLIVSTSPDIDTVAAALDDFVGAHDPHLRQPYIRVIPEQFCTSELRLDNGRPKGNYTSHWHVQQIVKIACAKVVRTPWYLVLDADIWWSHKATVTDLFETRPCTEKSRVCNEDGTLQYRSKQQMDHRGNDGRHLVDFHGWIAASCAALNMSQPGRQHRWSAGVTPQFMATEIGVLLQEYIQDQTGSPDWELYLMSKVESTFTWSEYNLYWLFGWYLGLWTEYHVPYSLHKMMSWGDKDLLFKTPCEFFNVYYPGYFSWVQSYFHIPPPDVWKAIRPCLEEMGLPLLD